jgi:hypothetical protein
VNVPVRPDLNDDHRLPILAEDLRRTVAISPIAALPVTGSRIDVHAASDAFLENVILDSAGEFFGGDSMTLRYRHVQSKQDSGPRVDGHRSGEFVERDSGEEALHVFNRVDGDADFADFAERHRIVGVVPDLGGEIECHG